MTFAVSDSPALPADADVAVEVEAEAEALVADVEAAAAVPESPAADAPAAAPAPVTPADDVSEAPAAPADDVSDADVSEGPAADVSDAPDDDRPTFADLGLPAEVVATLAEGGVTHPFPIQAATIPDALAGKDILGRGRTGSGKTLSFGLPLLVRLADGRSRPKRPRGVILTPTRELAMQVSDALQPFGDVLDLSLKVVCGGTSMQRQIFALERGVDILVATPGRLRDLIDRGSCALDDVEIAVLDEADQMADMGFLPEVSEILDLVPAGGQRLLFSATLENEIDTLVKRYLVEPVTHEVDPSAGAVTTMTHHVLVVKPKDKAPVTAAIAARKGRTIVFVRTQLGADRISGQLRDAGIRADPLHGGMTQGSRTHTMNDFKDGRVNVLVATDVAARGIHVDGIDLVLHVDPPADPKDYLHRAGRTARAGRSGTVVALILPHQRRSMFRLLEDAGVEAERHVVGRYFTPELAQITGARSLTQVQAEAAAQAAKGAQAEVEDLNRQLERAQRRAGELESEAAELKAKAEAEAAAIEAGEIPEPQEGDLDERPRGRGPRRDDRGPRRDDRGGFKRRDDRGPRSQDRRDDRGPRSYERRDDRGPRSYERRDDRGGRPFDRDRRDRDDRGSRGFDRRDERGPRSYERRDDRGGRPFDRDRRPADRDRRPFDRDRDRDRRPSDRRDDRGPRGFDRRDERGPRSYGGHRGHDRRDDRGSRSGQGAGTGPSADRKPRWKRNG